MTECSDGVRFLRAPNIPVPHGFSTRVGGISSISYLSSLNLGQGIGDSDQTVSENRQRFFRAALSKEFAENRIVSAKQIHSAKVLYVTESDCHRNDLVCDGFVTDRDDIALFIRVADCCPILFCDSRNHVIGAAHAGWRGSAAGIAACTVREMVKHGAKPENIRCAIGPCIHRCCFSVKEDFTEAIQALLPPSLLADCLHRGTNGHLYADLLAINRYFLLEAGVPAENMQFSSACTCCNPDLFFSHRATCGKRGLMGAVIAMTEK